MAEYSDEAEAAHAARMGKAILKGVAIGFPVCMIGLTGAIWLITDLSIVEAFFTAFLPGILLGGFAGGFAGIATTMD
ncbi:MAG TPA: hypothetical protein VFP42_08230 [Acidimicrobiia bacterium]|nr:hypothetical protein [Acidimicrobiia bacterium]